MARWFSMLTNMFNKTYNKDEQMDRPYGTLPKPAFRVNNYNEKVKDSSELGSLMTNPKQIKAKLVGFRSGDISDKDFIESDIPFATIAAAYDTDGYIRQGVDKYIDLIWKEGYDIYGKNPKAVEYIKQRFSYMNLITNVPIDIQLNTITEDLVKYHNVIIAKSRMTNPSQIPKGMKVTGIGGKQPVVGYFVLNAGTFSAKRDAFGTVTSWLQTSADGSKTKTFAPEDIIHMWYRREKGDLWGKPFLAPVLDDVRALREAEDTVLQLIWKDVFPFQHASVGSDEFPATQEDIDDVTNKLNTCERNGGIVTKHTVNIKAIANDKVIDASPYLKHFEERVFTGIGLPGIYFGRGDTANKSTSDNMTSEVSDKLKAYQRILESFYNNSIINELLIEGGFDPILNEDDKVMFKFLENDIDRQSKIQNQAVFLYQSNGITEDEMRQMLNKDPIVDGLQRQKMYANLVKTESSSTDTSEASNKVQPENQHGKKSSAKKDSENNNYEKNIKLIDNYCESVITFISDNEIDVKTHKQELLDGLSDIHKVYNKIVDDIDDSIMTIKIKELYTYLCSSVQLCSQTDDFITETKLLSELLNDEIKIHFERSSL